MVNTSFLIYNNFSSSFSFCQAVWAAEANMGPGVGAVLGVDVGVTVWAEKHW